MTKFADKVAMRAYFAVKSFFEDEKGDVNVVSIVVLIGIAIGLALLFKEQVAKLLGDLFKNQINPAVNGIAGKPTIPPT